MFKLENEKRWILFGVAALVIITAILYITTVIKYGDYFLLGSLEKMDNDDVKYIRSAKILIEKGMLTYHDPKSPTVFVMPGFPILLAGFIRLFGRWDIGVIAFRVFQALLQGFSVYMVFLIGRELFNSITGLIACVLDAVYMPEFFSAGLILTEVEFKVLLLLLVYLSIYAVKTGYIKYYIVGGIIWGAACLIRPTAALYPIVIFIMWLLYKYPIGFAVKRALITSMIFILVMSPWWIRNYAVFNRFIPFTLSTGNPFLQGTYINYDQTRDYVPYTPDVDVIKTNQIEMETGKYRLKTYFKKYPLQYIYWYTIGKTLHMWRDPFYWKPVFNITGTTAAKYHLILLALGLIGTVFSIRKKIRDSLFLILPIIYFTLVYLPYYTFSRYSYPTMPFVIILSAYGIYSLLNKLFWLDTGY